MTRPKNSAAQLLEKFADFSATPAAFVCAFVGIAFWAAAGMLQYFPENWRLMIDTSANVVTLLIVFLIQNTQRRARRSLEAKLDRLIEHASDRPLTSKDVEKIVNENIVHAREEDSKLFKNALALAWLGPLARFAAARASARGPRATVH